MVDIDITYILIAILIVIAIFGYIVIRDFLFLVNFLKEQRRIKIYSKQFKKYQDDKKKILDKRLQQEKELKKEYGLDYLEHQVEEIIGFEAPQGKHSAQELMQNREKYMRIMEAVKSGKSMYWRSMLGLANQITNNKEQAQGQGRSKGRSR